MDGLSAQIIIKALDGHAARAAVIAENIANAGSPNYRPLRLSFEEALSKATAQGSDAVSQVQPQFEQAESAAIDGEFRIDLELARGTTNAMRYTALVELLNRSVRLEALAISGGR